MAGKRVCVYCGKPKCGCKYRNGKMADFTMETWNTSEGLTIGEILETVQKTFGNGDPTRPAVFKMSVSYIDAKSLAKAKAKRVEA